MNKSVVGLLGGVSALALIGCAQSALAKPVLTLQPARSYAELLDPIPNASELIREVDRRPGFVEAQFYSEDDQPYHHHHHHHHHHHISRLLQLYSPPGLSPSPPPPSPSSPTVGNSAAGVLICQGSTMRGARGRREGLRYAMPGAGIGGDPRAYDVGATDARRPCGGAELLISDFLQ